MVQMAAKLLARGDPPVRRRLEGDQGVAQQLLSYGNRTNGVIENDSVELMPRLGQLWLT